MNFGLSVPAQVTGTAEELVRALIAIVKAPKPFADVLDALEKRRAGVAEAETEARRVIEAAVSAQTERDATEKLLATRELLLKGREATADTRSVNLERKAAELAEKEKGLAALDAKLKAEVLANAGIASGLDKRREVLDAADVALRTRTIEVERKEAALKERVVAATKAFETAA